MNNEWKDLELLNGWKVIMDFRPPQYKVDERGWVDLRGSASGPSGKAIAYIGPEYEGRIYWQSLYGVGFVETWVIDKNGYLYFYPYNYKELG